MSVVRSGVLDICSVDELHVQMEGLQHRVRMAEEI